MAELINVQSFPRFNFLQTTRLEADVSSGATSITVQNDTGFDTDHVILIGDPGNEGSEIATPSDVTSKVITVPALSNDHSKGATVYMLRANKARVYAAPNVDGTRPTTDTYTLLDTLTIIGDKIDLEHNHEAGGSDFWYLYTFYNDIPTTAEETDKVLTSGRRGGGVGSYVSVDEVRQEAGFKNNKFMEDSWVQDSIDDAQSEVKGTLSIAGYTLPLDQPVPGSVRRATLYIAAGFLLLTDYGVGTGSTHKEGEVKVAKGRELLASFLKNTLEILDDVTEEPVASDETKNVGGWPDDTTKDATEENAGGDSLFTRKQKL